MPEITHKLVEWNGCARNRGCGLWSERQPIQEVMSPAMSLGSALLQLVGWEELACCSNRPLDSGPDCGRELIFRVHAR